MQQRALGNLQVSALGLGCMGLSRGYGTALDRASKVDNMATYDTVFLGFPIRGETPPSVIRFFLSARDLSGKTLIPFATHGGLGWATPNPCSPATHRRRANSKGSSWRPIQNGEPWSV